MTKSDIRERLLAQAARLRAGRIADYAKAQRLAANDRTSKPAARPRERRPVPPRMSMAALLRDPVAASQLVGRLVGHAMFSRGGAR